MSAPVASPSGGTAVGSSTSVASGHGFPWGTLTVCAGLVFLVVCLAFWNGVRRRPATTDESAKTAEKAEKSAEEQLAELPLVKDVATVGGRYVVQYVLFVEDTETHRVVSGYDRYWRPADEEKKESALPVSSAKPSDGHLSGMKFERIFPKEAVEPAPEKEAPLPEKPVVSPTPQPNPMPPKAAEVRKEEKKKSPQVRGVGWALYGECPLGHLHPPCYCGQWPYGHYHACCNVVLEYKWMPVPPAKTEGPSPAQGRDIRHQSSSVQR